MPIRTDEPGRPRTLPCAPTMALLWVLTLTACLPTEPNPDTTPIEGHAQPQEVAPGMRFTDVGAGRLQTCATATDGFVYCWGWNHYDVLGGPSPATICYDPPSSPWADRVPCAWTPQRVVSAPPLHSLTGSEYHMCGLDEEGTAWCWGLRHFLGDGAAPGSHTDAAPCSSHPDLTCRASAAPVSGDQRFIGMHAEINGSGTCATAAGGSGWCWGLAGLASMNTGSSWIPSALPTSLAFEQVLIQGHTGCGLADGEAWCWGSNWYGTLGNGTTSDVLSTAPARTIGGHRYTQLAATTSSMCGLRSDGAALCWGRLLGLDGSHPAPLYGGTPRLAGGPAFVALAGGALHLCGLTAAGEAWCWGSNWHGSLGDGSRTDRAEPVRVRAPSGVVFRQIALGGGHTCGLATDGRLFCWGYNTFGQVGQAPVDPLRR